MDKENSVVFPKVGNVGISRSNIVVNSVYCYETERSYTPGLRALVHLTTGQWRCQDFIVDGRFCDCTEDTCIMSS